MSLKPQVRVSIINEIFSHYGKKIDDLFLLKDLRDAISALEKNDPVQGTAARADYFSYTNQPDQALIIINRAIKKYGNNAFFVISKLNASEFIGEWDFLKKTYEEVLMNEKIGNINEHLRRYIELCDLYIDDTGNFTNIMQSYDVPGYEKISSNINSMKQILSKQDITLPNYRKTVKIALSTIYERYNMPLSLAFKSINLQFIISSTLWLEKDMLDMTNAINDAIMEEEDLDFQVEADEIEVFCINFPIDQVPNDFSYYGEDSEFESEFENLIKSRMNVNSSPENDGEFLNV